MGSGLMCNEMLYCKDYMPEKAFLGLLEIEWLGDVFSEILGKVGLFQQ